MNGEEYCIAKGIFLFVNNKIIKQLITYGLEFKALTHPKSLATLEDVLSLHNQKGGGGGGGKLIIKIMNSLNQVKSPKTVKSVSSSINSHKLHQFHN